MGAACPDLTDAELLYVEELKKGSRAALAEEAEKVRQVFIAGRIKEMTKRGVPLDRRSISPKNWTRHVLLPDVFLEFDRLGSKAVCHVLADPKKFDGETLADPIEGVEYGTGKARLFFNADGTVHIHSFAHGGADYKLAHDAETLANEIENSDNKSAKRLCRLLIDAEVDAVEEDQLLGAIAKKCNATKASVKSMVNTEKQRRREAALGNNQLAVVDRLNKQLTYLAGQGVLRIMHDRLLDRDYYEFGKTAQMREMFANDLHVYEPIVGDPKEVTAFDIWMMSPGRNQYLGGAEFRPSALKFEVLPRYAARIEKYGSECLPQPYVSPPNVLNFWNGFGVTPKAGSWKKLFDHIRYVICNGDRVAFLYVIRWMAYAVQFPEKQGETVLVLRGKEGTGKGIVARAFIKLFGRHGLEIVQPEHLTGKFGNEPDRGSSHNFSCAAPA